MKKIAAFALLGAISLTALADDGPKPYCKQPVIPNLQASDTILHLFEKREKTYKDCLSKFIDEQKAIYTNTTDVEVAKTSHAAAEAAIKEYNDFRATLDERNSHADDTDDNDGGKPNAKETTPPVQQPAAPQKR